MIGLHFDIFYILDGALFRWSVMIINHYSIFMSIKEDEVLRKKNSLNLLPLLAIEH